jgi:hypothetical protein
MRDAPAVDYAPDPLGSRFPPCRVCGQWPRALRFPADSDDQGRYLITLHDCSHTVGVPWPADLALM